MASNKKSMMSSTRLFWMGMIPVICIMMLIILYFIERNNASYLYSVRDNVEAGVTQLDNTFMEINLYMNNILNNNENLIRLRKSTEMVDIIYYSNQFRSDVESTVAFLPSGYSFCIEIPEQDVFLYMGETGELYDKRQKILDVIQEKYHTEDSITGLEWKLLEIDDKGYLLQNYEINHCYFTCWIPEEKAFSFFETAFSAGEGEYCFVDANENLPSNVFSPMRGLLRQCLEMERLPLMIYYRYDHKETLQSTLLLVMIFILFLICLVAYSVWISFYFQRKIILPLQNFCQRVSNGKSMEELQHETEYCEISDAAQIIQTLYEQISELKISVYEETIRKQKTELEFLQLQLRPHFYINCLNIIFQMAQNVQLKRIQKFCVNLSNYMRYLFTNDVDLVPLEQELEHIKEYLYIQNIRFHTNVEIEHTEFPGSQLYVPSLVLLTLVENCVKHNQISLSSLKIEIGIQKEQNEICYTIRDNGKGFAEPETALQSEGSVGLHNIVRRLELIYSDRFHIVFFNDQGAVVKIWLPADREKDTIFDRREEKNDKKTRDKRKDE